MNCLGYYLLRPLTGAAKDWVRDNLPADFLKLGSNIYVETRYFADIRSGIKEAGLKTS